MFASQPGIGYCDSKYKRTIWQKLQRKFPSVCAADGVEDLFNPNQPVDFYFDVVKAATDLPTREHSIKTHENYLGFSSRNSHPSGAVTMEWFDHWIEAGA